MKTNKQNMTCMLLLIFAAVFFTNNIRAQVTIGADRPANSSAMLEVVSDTSGVLLPRVKLVSTTDFAPLSAHVQGMTVYNTETANDVVPGQYYNDGTRWVRMVGAEYRGRIVFVDNTDPNTATVFSLHKPLTNAGAPNSSFVHDASLEKLLDGIYVDTDTLNWIYDGIKYVRYNSASSSPWYLYGTDIDAGGNKTTTITRNAPIVITKDLDTWGTDAAIALQNNTWSNLSLIDANKWNRAIYSAIRPSPIEYTGAYYQLGYENSSYQQIDTLVQNNGYLIGTRTIAFREGKANGGTLSTLIGDEIAYGHSTGVTGTTDKVIGMQIRATNLSGKITNSYDIFAIGTDGTNVTNKYGIYIIGTEKTNYLQGKLGIGTSAPSEKLHVDGAIVVGTTTNGTPTNGTIRFNGTNLQVYINGWKNIATN